jgi:DNA helicase HerA-like ATPase
MRARTPAGGLATSIDGRHFTYTARPDVLDVTTGGYVHLGSAPEGRIGQVTHVALGTEAGARSAVVDGLVLDGPRRSFDGVEARAATPVEVRELLDGTRSPRAQLTVGALAFAPEIELALDAGAFRRHTFLCGQSGSGKTYALGTILERLLLETRLRIVILDPNSDFVRLAEPRDDAPAEVADAYADAARDVVVRGAGDMGPERIHVRFRDFDAAAQGACLRLDPIADRDEYAALVDLTEPGTAGPDSVDALMDMLRSSPDPSVRALGLRIRNLRVDRWQLWSLQDEGSLQALVEPGGPRCVVVDLGSLRTPSEKALAAEATLAALWRRREAREPTLVVIDEAHNVCPGAAADPITALATEHAVRIAGEGRKFGLTLLVSTQRPQKVHENVISQCDNLVLMRMNSLADLAVAGEVFSFVPEQLLARATDFGLGEAIVAGNLVHHPMLGRFGPRWSVEGGGDPSADWATPR